MMMQAVSAITVLAGLGAAGLAAAQDAPVVRHADDKYVAKDAPAPASNWKEQPWWAALAECAAAYGLEPADRANFQKFAGHAMKRVMDDRKANQGDAAMLVLPWTQGTGTGRKRAQIMADAFGLERVRGNCDSLFTQYQGLYPGS